MPGCAWSAGGGSQHAWMTLKTSRIVFSAFAGGGTASGDRSCTVSHGACPTALASCGCSQAGASAINTTAKVRAAGRILGSRFGVGGDLQPQNSIGVGHGLAALDLVNHRHAGDDLPDDGVFAIEERTIGKHDEELAVRRIRARRARHADNAALERNLRE